jgi:aflatoxin B1 aldehyde reductase
MAQIVLGAVAFGKPKPTTRDHPLASDDACEALLAAFKQHGGGEIDTARVYQNGNCEEMLGRLPSAQGLRIATKYHPTGMPGTLTEQLDQSLAALQRDSVEIFYPHMPSTSIDLEETLEEMNECYLAGKFQEFGLSNVSASVFLSLYF